jgi:hypothetical protein
MKKRKMTMISVLSEDLVTLYYIPDSVPCFPKVISIHFISDYESIQQIIPILNLISALFRSSLKMSTVKVRDEGLGWIYDTSEAPCPLDVSLSTGLNRTGVRVGAGVGV